MRSRRLSQAQPDDGRPPLPPLGPKRTRRRRAPFILQNGGGARHGGQSWQGAVAFDDCAVLVSILLY